MLLSTFRETAWLIHYAAAHFNRGWLAIVDHSSPDGTRDERGAEEREHECDEEHATGRLGHVFTDL